MVRFKNRYVLVELIWKDGRLDDTFSEAKLMAVLRDSMAVNYGDYGAGINSASLQVKYLNPLTNAAVVRCSRDQLQEVSILTNVVCGKSPRQDAHRAGVPRRCSCAWLPSPPSCTEPC